MRRASIALNCEREKNVAGSSMCCLWYTRCLAALCGVIIVLLPGSRPRHVCECLTVDFVFHITAQLSLHVATTFYLMLCTALHFERQSYNGNKSHNDWHTHEKPSLTKRWNRSEQKEHTQIHSTAHTNDRWAQKRYAQREQIKIVPPPNIHKAVYLLRKRFSKIITKRCVYFGWAGELQRTRRGGWEEREKTSHCLQTVV